MGKKDDVNILSKYMACRKALQCGVLCSIPSGPQSGQYIICIVSLQQKQHSQVDGHISSTLALNIDGYAASHPSRSFVF